ncbi:hypothetical protein BDU57DRAFT_535081 [Ampelomyces quisqualis]|uniref:Uncharacterized protein n=1 Tax=Ampelomyces quisqualis TaxID=50730 RepID=A0A6A5R659_AMPQU|nr:hypothetical protein BDU57DRAFT_535081 [Ampelomyces quisqualis]
MQVMIADDAIGPGVRQVASALINATETPGTAGDKALCNSIKVRKAGGFVKVNVFGLTFLIATSLLLTLVDVVLLKYIIYLSKFRKALSPRIDRLIQDGVLQLQRRAYEAQGQGTWSELDKDVPLTRPRLVGRS